MEEKKDYRKELFYEKKNGYDSMDAAAREAMEAYCEGYKAYLNDSRTEREAVANAIRLAEREGFVEYRAGMELKAGDKVWFNNRGKALMLAVAGKKPLSEGVVVAAAHVDAPRLDLKQTPLYEDNELAFFKTHYYGGIKKYQWTAIPLELHGVVATKDGEVIEVVIGREKDDPQFVISDLYPASADPGRGFQGREPEHPHRLRSLRRRGRGQGEAGRHEHPEQPLRHNGGGLHLRRALRRPGL